MLKPGSAKTFSEYAHSVFIPHIMATYRGDLSRVDLVWDQYIPNSLKQTTRSRRGRGVRRRVVSEGKIIGNWHSFLHVDGNKTDLFVSLSDAPLHSFTNTENMWLIVTYGNMVRSKPDLPVRQEPPACSVYSRRSRQLDLSTCCTFSRPWEFKAHD